MVLVAFIPSRLLKMVGYTDGDCIDGKRYTKDQFEIYSKAYQITQKGSKETGINLDV